MSGLWSRTLVYLGLREEDDELYYDYDVADVDDATQRRRDERRSAVVEDVAAPVDAERSRGRRRWEDAERDDPRAGLRDRDADGGRDPRGTDGREGRRDRERDRSDEADRGRGGERRVRESRRGVGDRDAEPLTDSGRIARIGDDAVRQLRPEERPRAPVGALVRVVQVTAFDDAEVIGTRFRTGQPVLFDLSSVESELARRVLDFVSGMTFVLHGTLRKVGKRSFLLVPDAVTLAPDERRRLSDLGYDLSNVPTH